MEWTIAETPSVYISQEKRDMRGRYAIHAYKRGDKDRKTVAYVTSSDESETQRIAQAWLKRHAIEYKIASAFVAVLRDWLTPAQWKEMRKRNKAETDLHICHSHDFCDANMAMVEAWEKLGLETPCGLEQNATPEQHKAEEHKAAVWSFAWDLAMPRLGGIR